MIGTTPPISSNQATARLDVGGIVGPNKRLRKSDEEERLAKQRAELEAFEARLKAQADKQAADSEALTKRLEHVQLLESRHQPWQQPDSDFVKQARKDAALRTTLQETVTIKDRLMEELQGVKETWRLKELEVRNKIDALDAARQPLGQEIAQVEGQLQTLQSQMSVLDQQRYSLTTDYEMHQQTASAEVYRLESELLKLVDPNAR